MIGQLSCVKSRENQQNLTQSQQIKRIIPGTFLDQRFTLL